MAANEWRISDWSDVGSSDLGDDRAGAQPPLELFGRLARDGFGGARERLLDLGDRGDRDFGRQDVVEDMIVAQIGVREDVIADPLAGAQPAAMADHQPGVGAYQDRKSTRLNSSH